VGRWATERRRAAPPQTREETHQHGLGALAIPTASPRKSKELRLTTIFEPAPELCGELDRKILPKRRQPWL
jgi:hypothetical protein